MPDSIKIALDPDELPDAAQSMTLAARAQKGDRSALNNLFERYQDRLQRVVRIQLGSEMRQYMDSMDVVQDTYEVAYRKFPDLELRDPGAIINWLSRIAVNQIRDAHDRFHAQKRDRRREKPIDAPVDTSQAGAAQQLSANTTRPDERVAREEIKGILDEVVAELPDEYRQVILMRDYCGCNWQDVLSALRRDDLHAVQQMHQRAWIKLRRQALPRLKGLF
jgi:RNA polymerase sigma-70 factor (ECF subfamily)